MVATVAPLLLSMSCDSGMLQLIIMARAVSCFTGYFNFGDSTLLNFFRANGTEIALFIYYMVAVLFGMQSMSLSFFMLMLVSLFDIF